MNARYLPLLSVFAGAVVSATVLAAPDLVFDFECARISAYPEGEIRIDIDSELLRHGAKPWNDRAVSCDLNRDGAPEFFVPTLCGATGNCDWGVFTIDPPESLGLISGARFYVEDTGASWLQLTTYTASGAGEGVITVYRMSETGYVKVSSRSLEDPENSEFLTRMGEPSCRRGKHAVQD